MAQENRHQHPTSYRSDGGIQSGVLRNFPNGGHQQPQTAEGRWYSQKVNGLTYPQLVAISAFLQRFSEREVALQSRVPLEQIPGPSHQRPC